MARVIGFNPRSGLVAVQTDSGITIFELIGDYEISIGDSIRGDFETHGGETYRNVTSGEEMDVFVQAIHCSPKVAHKMMA